MSLKSFFNEKKLKAQKTSASEIRDLFGVAKRDLTDVTKAKALLSSDCLFSILYNSSLKLCTILLRSQGYRARSLGHHKITIECLPFVLDKNKAKYVKYLDTCRVKRNKVEYDKAGIITDEEVEELLEFTQSFLKEVEQWMYANHRELMDFK